MVAGGWVLSEGVRTSAVTGTGFMLPKKNVVTPQILFMLTSLFLQGYSFYGNVSHDHGDRSRDNVVGFIVEEHFFLAAS
jgi:hypothetical protein